MRILSHNAQVLSVAFSPDGQTILTNTLEGETFLWEMASGKLIQKFRQAVNQTLFALFSPDGRSIFSPSLGYGESTLYEIASEQERRLWQAVGTFSAAFSRDGASLLIGGEDGEQGVVQMFDIEAGQLQQVFETHQEWEVDSVMYSSDESCVLAGSGHDLYIWESATGRPLHHLASLGVIRCLAVSPVYTMVLAGCQDGIRVWNITSGNLEATLGLAAPIHSIAFSPDGAFLLSGGDDAIACLWQWPEQTLVQTFARHTSSITSVAFSSDGKAILTGSIDGTACIWPIVTGDQL
jgi:WD40 repeat protein